LAILVPILGFRKLLLPLTLEKERRVADVHSWDGLLHCRTPASTERSRWQCYDDDVYAQKFRVELVIGGERRASPLEWLDQFCMRNFTNAAEFDDTLPLEDGLVEVSFRVTAERFAESFGAWLKQRGKGEGRDVGVEISKVS
jgi:hypothetical protein